MKYFEFPESLLVTGLPYVRTHLHSHILYYPFQLENLLARAFNQKYCSIRVEIERTIGN